MCATLFVYGSLMCREVLEVLLVNGSFTVSHRVSLSNYRRSGISGVTYPAIHEAPGHEVHGMLVELHTQQALDIIDTFEDAVSEHPVSSS